MYTYPDVAIVCDQPKFEDDVSDTLLNPTVLIEVLSDSTEAYDRGLKAAHYRKIESLQHYLFVSQKRCSVEITSRGQDGSWRLSEVLTLTGQLKLDQPKLAIDMSEIYRNVSFDAVDGNEKEV